MNSQNTPVHIRLWHRDFWLMAIANLLLTMSVYMLIPVMPKWLMENQGLTAELSGLAMAAFGVGLWTMGAFVSYLVQHYRRNSVYHWAVVTMVVSLLGAYYYDTQFCWFADVPVMIIQRFVLGAAFGLAQMVLASTLVIDTCESYQRTEANHSASWFGRFALSLGPLTAMLLCEFSNFDTVLLVAVGCATASLILVKCINFPFRAPQDDIPVVSLDRFFLPHGFPLFINLVLIMMAVGLVLATPLKPLFYSMMMVGFLLAILAQRFVFRDAEVKSESVSSLIAMGAALLMMITRSQDIVQYAAPTFIGFGTGVLGSRFLLFFIKLSRHCQRGTSQSTFMLGWESGMALGVGLGVAFFNERPQQALMLAFTLIIVAILMYQFTHNWFARNKNR